MAATSIGWWWMEVDMTPLNICLSVRVLKLPSGRMLPLTLRGWWSLVVSQKTAFMPTGRTFSLPLPIMFGLLSFTVPKLICQLGPKKFWGNGISTSLVMILSLGWTGVTLSQRGEPRLEKRVKLLSGTVWTTFGRLCSISFAVSGFLHPGRRKTKNEWSYVFVVTMVGLASRLSLTLKSYLNG